MGARTARGLRAEPLRSGLFVAWLGAWLSGRAPADDVLAAVQGAEGPASVTDLPGEAGPAPLAWALGVLRRLGPQRVRLALPVPGDVAGLPADVARSALVAGEAVVLVPSPTAPQPGLVLVPEPATDRAPADGPGTGRRAGHAGTTWRALRVAAPGVAASPAAPVTLRDAERELAAAVRGAAQALAACGPVSALPPEVAAAVAELRRDGASAGDLPPGSPGLAVRVLATADRLDAVLALAGPGGPLSANGAERRAEALREVATAVRRARTAGYTACADGVAEGLAP